MGWPAATAAPLQPDRNPVTVTSEIAGGQTLGVQCSFVQVQLLILMLNDVEQLLALQVADSTLSARAPADAGQTLDPASHCHNCIQRLLAAFSESFV